MNVEYVYLFPGPGRAYKIDGEYYPGVTSILNGFKIKKSDWVQDAAKIGTICHNDISTRYGKPKLQEIMIWQTPQAEVYAAMRRFRKMWSSLHIENVIDVEIPIKYKDGDVTYASQIDIIHKVDNDVYLSDIKTGNWYDHYPMQLAAYYQAARKQYDIDKLSILRCDISLDRNPNSIPEVTIFDVQDIEKLIPEFNKMAIDYNKKLKAWIKQNL